MMLLLQHFCHSHGRRWPGEFGAIGPARDTFVSSAYLSYVFVSVRPTLIRTAGEKQAQNKLSHAISRARASLTGGGLHFALQVARVMSMNELVGRIRAEFLEMPGLRLTLTQASRLWGLDEGACRQVINVLIGSSFLRWTRAGTIARVDD